MYRDGCSAYPTGLGRKARRNGREGWIQRDRSSVGSPSSGPQSVGMTLRIAEQLESSSQSVLAKRQLRICFSCCSGPPPERERMKEIIKKRKKILPEKGRRNIITRLKIVFSNVVVLLIFISSLGRHL